MSKFDGVTFEDARDGKRLTAQIYRVFAGLKDHQWHTLTGLSLITGDPESSVSARIRDLRKSRYGGYTIERRYVKNGLWEYKLHGQDTTGTQDLHVRSKGA